MSIFAPARPKGYSVKDLKEIAARHDELVVAGRGGDDLVDRLRAFGARVTPVGSDLDIARSLARAPNSVAALARLLAVPSPPRPESRGPRLRRSNQNRLAQTSQDTTHPLKPTAQATSPRA